MTSGEARRILDSLVLGDSSALIRLYGETGEESFLKVLSLLLRRLIEEEFGASPRLSDLIEYARKVRADEGDPELYAWQIEGVLRAGAVVGDSQILDGLDPLLVLEVLGLVLRCLLEDLALGEPDLKQLMDEVARQAVLVA